MDGRMRLNILGPARPVAYRIDSPAGSVRITQPGEYRIALLHGERRRRQLETRGASAARPRCSPTRARLRCAPVSGPTRAPAWRRPTPTPTTRRTGTRSIAGRRRGGTRGWACHRSTCRPTCRPTHLCSTRTATGATRSRTATSGIRASRPDWRPYYNGRWASYPRYGWTWIGADRFAWPTHHYGRWGFSAGVVVLDSRRALGAGLCLVGLRAWLRQLVPARLRQPPDDSPSTSRVGPGYYSPWRGWTAVTYSHFGGGYWVNQRAVNWDRFSGTSGRRSRRAGPRPGLA